MAKRFFETSIWTQNRWFRELKPTSKLFWFYLIGNCDNVGVWEEDWALASFITGATLDPEDILNDIDGRVVRISPKKLWISDFCDFQYKNLRDNPTDKPRLSYIELLKKHGLWEEYLYPFDTPCKISNTLKDKDKVTDKEKVPEREKEQVMDKDEFDYNFDEDENT